MPNPIEASAKSPAADLPDLNGYIFYISLSLSKGALSLLILCVHTLTHTLTYTHTLFKLVKPHSNGGGNKCVNTSSAVWSLLNSMHGLKL